MHFHLRHFAVVAVLFALTFHVQAQESTEAKSAAVERYMRAVPTEKMMRDAYAEVAKQLPTDQRAEFILQMNEIVRVDVIERTARAAMIKTFSLDELNALADFYTSKHGASAMAKFGSYMTEVMPLLMQEMQRAIQERQATKK